MGLPGGRREPVDTDLVDTAIRETAEELGLELRREMLIGELDDVYPRTVVSSPFLVRPFLFALPEPFPVTPSYEVANAEWLPVDRLLDPAAYQRVTLDIRGSTREVMGYVLDRERVIWGMTERVLTPIVEALRR
jgi:8-oxo-dGTP pyrophosphatase MutT (NUDIX family)